MPGLYLHIPFCEFKCLYCDFYSVAPNGAHAEYEAMIERFTRSLFTEIEMRRAEGRWKEEFDTIFFGGGTPSLLEPKVIGDILNRLHSSFRISPDAEITLEANPGTVHTARLRDFRSAGINRLSMGIQSFFDDDLKFLSRIHTSQEAKDAVKGARAAGFTNLNFDLIFALPSQTPERWRENLRQAVELDPDHLSCYSLIVEPGTPLYRMVEAKQVTPLPLETDAEMYEETITYLTAHGYEIYEISNFAKPGHKCRHNTTYWEHGDYLGFGPSAHSFRNNLRWWNVSSIEQYSASIETGKFPVRADERLTDEQLKREMIFLGLRSAGVNLARYKERFGEEFTTGRRDVINRHIEAGYMSAENNRLKLTLNGYPLCDEIALSLDR